MRHQLKPKTPSAGARLRYITREGRYAVGLDGPRDDLRATGSANLPGWARGDAAVFWSAVDGYERANARRCLELELNLPRELGRAQQVAAVRDYLARLTAEAGPMPCTWAIHNAGDGNPHVHLMIQERPLDGHERTAETWFKRANRAAPEKGGAIKSQWWHDYQHVFWSRALWADACNQALTQAGHEARFDARSKAVRFDEALENGDWLGAVLLSTLTERHEGVAVAGMRRRLERDECWLEDLPDYAQRLIAYNDGARAHNCRLRDWARTATEAELLAYLAPELERRNPGAHVAAWEAAQQVQAFDEDRQRAVASAQQAGELELLSAAQIEQAERAAIAAELGELIALEQGDQLGDLLAIEVEQAHGAALVEDSARTAAQRAAELAAFVATERGAQQRNLLAIERAQAEARQRAAEEQARAQREAAELAELTEAEQADHQSQLASIEVDQAHGAALLENVRWYRAQIAALEQRGAGSPPSAAIRARELQEAARRAREAAERAAADALAWRQEHPLRAALADRAGIALGVDQAAAEAQAAAVAAARAYSRSPLLIEARRWAAENRQLQQLQERLPAVERAAGIEPQAERDARAIAALNEASRALRRAAGWIENRMSRATADEMRELGAMRAEVEAARVEVERLREQLPEPGEAERLRASALQHLERVDSWRPVSERPQERQEQPHERPQRGTEDAPRPPRNRGPRMG